MRARGGSFEINDDNNNNPNKTGKNQHSYLKRYQDAVLANSVGFGDVIYTHVLSRPCWRRLHRDQDPRHLDMQSSAAHVAICPAVGVGRLGGAK